MSGATRRRVAELLFATRDLARAATAGELDRVSAVLERRLALLAALLAAPDVAGDPRLVRPLARAGKRGAAALAALAARGEALAAELAEIRAERRRGRAYHPAAAPASAGFWLDRTS